MGKCEICGRPKGDPHRYPVAGECTAPDSTDYTVSLQCLSIALRKAQEALAAARRECDEARALAEKWAMREAAGVERGIRADADALSEIQGLHIKVERLRGDLVKYGSHVDECNGDDFCSCGLDIARLQAASAALAAPADGEEGKR